MSSHGKPKTVRTRTHFYALAKGAKKEPESDRDLVQELWMPLFHNDKHETIAWDFDEIVHGCGSKVYQRPMSGLATMSTYVYSGS